MSSIKMSHCYGSQVLRFPDSLRPSCADCRVWGDLYVCVCVCCLRSYEREGGLLEKRTKEGGRGCIIGLGAARRHNDMAIDSGMSS